MKNDTKERGRRVEAQGLVEKKEVGLEVGLMGLHREEGGLTFARIERKTPVHRSALLSNQSSLGSFHRSTYRVEGGPNGQIVSIKRTTDGRK